MQEIHVSPEEIKKLLQFKENFVIFNKQYSKLQEHLGEYVAIGDGKILGFSPEKDALLNKFQKVSGLFVEQVTSESIPWIL